MGELTHETAHVAKSLAKLADMFKDKVKFTSLCQIYLEQIQELENAIFAYLQGRRINSPNFLGVLIDRLGALAGQPRGGADDAEYLLRIQARMMVNKKSARREDIYAIFRVLLPTATLAIEEYYPAAFTLTVSGVVITNLDLYKGFLRDAKGGGINATLIYVPPGSFGFAGGSNLGFSVGVYA